MVIWVVWKLDTVWYLGVSENWIYHPRLSFEEKQDDKPWSLRASPFRDKPMSIIIKVLLGFTFWSFGSEHTILKYFNLEVYKWGCTLASFKQQWGLPRLSSPNFFFGGCLGWWIYLICCVGGSFCTWHLLVDVAHNLVFADWCIYLIFVVLMCTS